MLERDVLLSKIAIIKNCLQRIKEVTHLDPATLDDFNVQDIYVLNLERAVQAAIDMANTVIAAHNYRLPNSYKMAFFILFENGWIDQTSLQRMQSMVGFRNIAIHDYQEIAVAILKSILTEHLDDFEIFYRQVMQRYNEGSDL